MRYAILLIPDLGKEVVNAEYANHNQIYLCPECGRRVRLTRESYRSSAFFSHYERTGNCSLESSNSGNGDYYPTIRSVNEFFDYPWKGQSQKRLAAAIIDIISYSHLGYLATLDSGKRAFTSTINKGYDIALDKTQAIIYGAKLFEFNDIYIILNACFAVITPQYIYRFLRVTPIKKALKNRSKITSSLQTQYEQYSVINNPLISDYHIYHKTTRKILLNLILNFDGNDLKIFIFIIFIRLFSVEILESGPGSLVTLDYCGNPDNYEFQSIGCFDLNILRNLANDKNFLEQAYQLFYEKPDSASEEVIFIDLILTGLIEFMFDVDWSVLPYFYHYVSSSYRLSRNYEHMMDNIKHISEYHKI
ncbi:hypothetical protein [Synechococcus sp. PCC 6312]|uniref:hypothetical protein n=1 Tax=Synechococcus sp. (strain ATCC 27167 / PCC 6312) TaxID=195253 RepID=UPI00029F1C10|nr:hypothetical protein [Synechococcus sp. PCC 6312]AFY59475.1 hypothetical protein Syn6312_0234 [Synechococcus sp. PCC 6312]